MTPERAEEIRIMSLPGMQKFIREKMGPIVEGDHVALRFDKNSIDIGFVTQTKTMEKDIISADLVYVRWYSDKPWRDQSCDKRDWANEHFIRLPLPIDPDNPSRGLWGMVDKTKYRIDLHHLGATVTQMYSADGSVSYDMKTYTTPTLALLKAIAAQEGIEI